MKGYDDIFTGLGRLPGKYDIDTDKTVKPVQHAPRRVPVPLKAKLKENIKDLQKREIITPDKITSTQTEKPAVCQTRSGRKVHQPTRLKDYVQYFSLQC